MVPALATRGAVRVPDEILTAKEAAALLRVSVDVVCAGADAGDIPCAWVGKRRRFSKRALLEVLSQPHPRSSRCSQGAPVSAVKRVQHRKLRSVQG